MTRSQVLVANSTSWVATTIECPLAGELVEDPGQGRLGLVVEAPGGFVEGDHGRGGRELDGQHQRELLSGGQISRMRVRRDAGRDRLEDPAGRRRGSWSTAASVPVGLGEFGLDGVEVQQVGRGLRDEADQAPGGGRRELGRVRVRRVRR